MNYANQKQMRYIINEISCIALIAMYSFTILKQYVSGALFLIVFLTWLISSLFLEKKWILKRGSVFLPILICVFVHLCFYLYNPSILETQISTLFYIVFFAWPIMLAFYSNSSLKQIERIIKSFLLFFSISVIYTLRGLIIYPEAARTLASSYRTNFNFYTQMGIADYGFIYATAFLIGVLTYTLMSYKKTNFKFGVQLLLLLSSMFLIFKASYTIAIIISMFLASYISIVSKRKNRFIVGLIFLFFLIVLYLFSAEIIDIMINVTDKTSIETVNNRLIILKQAIISNSMDSINRIHLYKLSFTTFIDNPFFGTKGFHNSLIGGHSDILDHLALYGIFGILFIFLILFCFFKQNKTLTSLKNKQILTTIQMTFLVFATINTFVVGYTITLVVFFIIPLIFIIIDRNINQKPNNSL